MPLCLRCLLGEGLIPSSGVMEVTAQFFVGGGLFSNSHLSITWPHLPVSQPFLPMSPKLGPHRDLDTQPAPWS